MARAHSAFTELSRELRALPEIQNRVRYTTDTCKPLIVCDSREGRSLVPAALAGAGANVYTDVLPIGDYLLGSDCVVERKAQNDYQASIEAGHLQLQLERQALNY